MGFTCLGTVLIRPWVRRNAADQNGWNTLIGAVYAAYVVFYGITLALIAVSAYQGYVAANQTVGREAAALGTLYRDVSSYPEPIRGELQAMLRDYTRYVIEEAWPAQRRGVIPEGGTRGPPPFRIGSCPSSHRREPKQSCTPRPSGSSASSSIIVASGCTACWRDCPLRCGSSSASVRC